MPRKKQNAEVADDPLPFNRKLLQFMKEWGPALTVLYAIVYTFPFQIFDRFILNPEANNLAIARKAISDSLAIQNEWTTKVSTINGIENPSELDRVNSVYYYKILTILASQRDAIDYVKSKLPEVELETIGNLYFGMSDFERSIEFYRLAMKKTRASNGASAPLSRELGNVLFRPGPTQNIGEARENYFTAIKVHAEGHQLGYNIGPYLLQDVAELANNEAFTGHVKCAEELAEIILTTTNYNPSDRYMQQIGSTFMKGMEFWTKSAMPNEAGCPYELPETGILVGSLHPINASKKNQ